MIFTKFYIRIFKILINKLSINRETIYLGTNYGGWSLIDQPKLKNNIIISAGVGEDISFDVEMINKYDLKVIFVDPTPRALQHLSIFKNSLGNPKTGSYLNGGLQPIEAYDLTGITESNFFIVDKALFNTSGKIIKFFSPPNKEHVSHSISNWQNNFKKESEYIEVQTISLSDLLKKHNIDNISMIKLDIEGAEIEVINDMIKNKIYPNQLLVEFDELHNNLLKGYLRATNIFLKLIKNNYKLVKTSRYPNFLFIKDSFV